MKKKKSHESHSKNKKKMYDMHFCAAGTPPCLKSLGISLIYLFILNLLFRFGVQPDEQMMLG